MCSETYSIRNVFIYGQNQPSSGGSRIYIFFKTDQTYVLGFPIFDGFQKLLERSAKKIQTNNGEAVTGRA